ncbi:hypothetical protein GCM10011318_15810 [Phaeocystidibacter marisrubri]|nr:hypothetical protein GCM10011318_15810 [Phaeocystidibacter marisrubri]
MNPVSSVKRKSALILFQYLLIAGMIVSAVGSSIGYISFYVFVTCLLVFGYVQVLDALWVRVVYQVDIGQTRDRYENVLGIIGMYYVVGRIVDLFVSDGMNRRMDMDVMNFVFWVYIITMVLPLAIRLIQNRGEWLPWVVYTSTLLALFVTTLLVNERWLIDLLFYPFFILPFIGFFAGMFSLILQNSELSIFRRMKNHSPLI